MTRQRGLIGAAVLTGAFALFTLLATLVQGANRRSWASVTTGYDVEAYPASAHAVAMTAVFAVAMVAALILLNRGLRTAAVLTAAGAGFGPMMLVAAPFSQQMVLDTSSASGPSLGTSTAWYALVASVLTVLIVGSAALVLGRWPSPSTSRRWVGAHLAALIGLGLLVVVVPSALTDDGGSTLLPMLVIGYLLLVAGVVMAAAVAHRRLMPLAVLQGTVVIAVWALYAAYHREGGAPGVAGWEFGTSPTIATVITSTALVCAPLVGVLGAYAASWVVSLRTRSLAVTKPSPA
jgi:hypothetical protein